MFARRKLALLGDGRGDLAFQLQHEAALVLRQLQPAVLSAVTFLDGDLQTVNSRLDQLAIGLDVIEIDRHGFLLFGFKFLVNIEAAQTEFSQPVLEPTSQSLINRWSA